MSVHRLVQAVTVDQMPAELAAQWRQAASAVIEAAIPGDGGEVDAWPEFAALLPHTQAALGADRAGLGRIADYLGYSGNYLAARELARRMLEGRIRARGPEHLDTLNTRASLAYWTGAAGDPAAARDQYAALLPVIVDDMMGTGPTLCVPDLLPAFTLAEGIMRLTCRRRPVSDPLCPRVPGMRLGLPAPGSGMMSVMSRNAQVVPSTSVPVRVVPRTGR